MTGAANGIGFETTRRLLGLGCNVIAADIDVKSLMEKDFGEKGRLKVILNTEISDQNEKNQEKESIQVFKKALKELREKGKDQGLLIPVYMDVGKLKSILFAKMAIMDVVFDSSSEAEQTGEITNSQKKLCCNPVYDTINLCWMPILILLFIRFLLQK